MDSRISNLALLTDLYQLTMVQGYWKSGIAHREAVFHLNFRTAPFEGGFAIAAGLQTAIEFIQAFHFSKSDLDYLGALLDVQNQSLFDPQFLEFLSTFDCRCDIDAMPEGTAVFPHEPMVRVKGPLWQAALLESPLLNIINFQTLIASKASRICLAADGDPVIEFGMRRAQGIDGALSASRAAFIGGCYGTSDVLAGKLFDIPVRGTHGHSWVMAFPSEREAFKALVHAMPNGCVFLVDTYDAIAGTQKAIQVARESPGFRLTGIRIDSGDLAGLSTRIRKILDAEGFFETIIMASNELDEHSIADLKRRGAPIHAWGVGTQLVTGKHQAALDGIYKLSAIQDSQQNWQYKLKISESPSKITNPGILQVRRWFDGTQYMGDAIYDDQLKFGTPFCAEERIMPDTETIDLLVPIFRQGRLVYAPLSLQKIQEVARQEVFRMPGTYFVGLEKRLQDKKLELIRAFRA